MAREMSDRRTILRDMDDVCVQDLQALTSALFDALAGSLWVRLHSATIPAAAWPPPESVGVIDIHFSTTRRDRLRGLRLPVPSSPLPQPWGLAWGPKSEDWANTIRMWMEEQVVQGCDDWASKNHDGYVAYFEIGQEGLLAMK
jgi:hypothetical protein